VAAIVHTHPYKLGDREDTFSTRDFNLLIEFRDGGFAIEKMAMISRQDYYIRTFAACGSDRAMKVADLFPDTVALWKKYVRRVQILCVGSALKLPECMVPPAPLPACEGGG
jgi:hypothetical protein